MLINSNPSALDIDSRDGLMDFKCDNTVTNLQFAMCFCFLEERKAYILPFFVSMYPVFFHPSDHERRCFSFVIFRVWLEINLGAVCRQHDSSWYKMLKSVQNVQLTADVLKGMIIQCWYLSVV